MEKDEFLMSGDVSSPIGQDVLSSLSEPDQADLVGSFANTPLMESSGDVFDAIARLLRQAVLKEAAQIASIIAHSVQQGRRL